MSDIKNWAKIVVGSSHPYSLVLLAIHNQLKPNHIPLAFNFLSVSLLLAFSFSLFALVLQFQFPNITRLLERIGLGFALLTVFFTISFALSCNISWVVPLICALPFAPLLHPIGYVNFFSSMRILVTAFLFI